MTHLQRFDNDGLELIIDTQTGESFASKRGYARMSGKDESTIRKRLKGVHPDLIKTATIHTPGGLQGADLICEDLIVQWLPKDNPEMATKMLKLGVRAFLHTLAGYTVSSTATQPLTPLDILEQQVKWMRQHEAELKKVQFEVQQLNEFKNEIKQTQQEAIAQLKLLDPPTLIAAPLATKEKLNRLIRDFSITNKLSFSYVYSWIYREFRDRYHIDLQIRAKNHKPKLTGMEYAQKYDLIEQLYATASEVLL